MPIKYCGIIHLQEVKAEIGSQVSLECGYIPNPTLFCLENSFSEPHELVASILIFLSPVTLCGRAVTTLSKVTPCSLSVDLVPFKLNCSSSLVPETNYLSRYLLFLPNSVYFSMLRIFVLIHLT